MTKANSDSGSNPITAQPNLVWQSAPANLTLPNDEVHIWRIRLNRPERQVQPLSAILSPEEQAKAQRFYFERDRRRHIVSHAAQRMILGRYLNIEPTRLRFSTGVRGKPYLAEEFSASGIEFNLSHSEELAMLAVTRRRAIGVDVEYIKLLPDAKEIAVRFFSARESAAWCALPESQQAQGFFNCWTRKEAYIKGTGDGLYLPLDQFDVAFVPGEPARMIEARGKPEEAARWELRELEPGARYAGAVAVAGHNWQLRCWEWVES